MWETLRDMYRRELKKIQMQNLAKQRGPHMNHNGNTSRRCRSWGEKKTVMITRPTLSNVPAVEELALGSTPKS
jgi:hypothetical protein